MLRHSGHGQNVILRFLVALGTDVIVDHVPLAPDRCEGARMELARLWVGVGSNHLLE
jgi:hypothetical protein